MKLSSIKRIATSAIALACVSSGFAQQNNIVVGEVFAADAKLQGSVILAGSGMQIASGSGVTAGSDSALLKLSRGGELRVCPQTTVTVAASNNGRDLLFALGSGALQVDYKIAASADAILTPDFRIQLPGPGLFKFAVRADSGGNTCIRALEGNTSSVIVSELMGDGTYQVKPAEQVLFRDGKVSEPWPVTQNDCGCPPPQFLQQRAVLGPALGSAQEPAPVPNVTPTTTEVALAAPAPVMVEAPMVYRGGETVETLPIIPAQVRFASLAKVPILTMAVVPPPEEQPEVMRPVVADRKSVVPESDKKSGGVFQKVGRFFARLFGGGRGA